MKTILSLCDYTGNWPKFYREAGYTVIQVDLKYGDDARLWPSRPSVTPRFPREFVDIRDLPKIHGVLAAPVCQFFSGSGAKHPRSDEQILFALSLVDACLRIVHAVKPDWWALENPVGKLVKWLGDPFFSFDPYMYGGYLAPDERSSLVFPCQDAYLKHTLLWGSFALPVKAPVTPAAGSIIHSKFGGKSERTKTFRSTTPMGFAKAFFQSNP